MVLTVARGGDEYDIVTEAQPGARPNNTRASEIRAGGKVEGFKRVSGTPPAFPVEAAKRGASGTVALFGTVRTDGALAEVTPLARRPRQSGDRRNNRTDQRGRRTMLA
jgi:outer membrane biosynthesis protein TonB